jgi:hypothetical protein|nr:WG repeat-containing protein [uncultured Acetatifactor sp.]
MKKIRIVLMIFMLVLVGYAWVSQAGGAVKANALYQKGMEEAKVLMEARLYQKAIASLESALSIKESPEARRMWRDAYALAYEDGVVTKKQCVRAMETTANLQSDKVENWEELIGFCLETQDYSSANAYCEKAEKAGVSSEKLEEFWNQAHYSYSVRNRVHTQVLYSPSGYSAVTNGEKWGLVDSKGDWEMDCEYGLISPVADSLVRLVGMEGEFRIIDDKDIVQSILNKDVVAAKAAGDGIVPVLYDESWGYYDISTSEFSLSKYEDVSTFANGIAAVRENGSWKLIDTEGGQIESAVFEDVKLYGSGEYLHNGVFTAKRAGSYGLYNQKAEQVADISCSDMDVCFDGGIAYQGQDGKWGFMDKKGKVMIEPQYEKAKSFSNGLAAVCMDGMWGFINESGEMVIECRFLDAGYFTSGGVCFVSELEGEYYMITLRFAEG